MSGPTKKEKISTLKRFNTKNKSNFNTTGKKHEKALFKTLKEAEKYKSPLVRQALTIARMAVSPIEGMMKINAQTVKNLSEKVKEDKAKKKREEKRKLKANKI